MDKSIKINRQTDDQTEVDLTPLLDVVFIILIFFIVSASFLNERGVPVLVPDRELQPENPITVIVLEINSKNEIRIEDRLVDLHRVRPTAVKLLSLNHEVKFAIKLSPEAKTRMVIGALDGLRQANVAQPSISLTSS